MAICGKCKEEGVNVAHVRACYGKTGDNYLAERKPLGEVISEEEDPFPGEEPEVSKAERTRHYVDVSYADKDQAKEMGAKWDPKEKKWFFWDELPENMPGQWKLRLFKQGEKEQEEELEDGIYFLKEENNFGGTYFMLYHTVHGANQQVAKELVLYDEEGRAIPYVEDPSKIDIYGYSLEWVYRGKAPLRLLGKDDLLSGEEAAQFGQVYGRCGKCGKLLTKEESKERGLGPKCAGL